MRKKGTHFLYESMKILEIFLNPKKKKGLNS
jgi:hypothetical protein